MLNSEWTYTLFGLTVTSNVPLPTLPTGGQASMGALKFVLRDADPAGSISSWQELYSLPYGGDESRVFLTIARRGERLLLRVDDSADFVVDSGGETITCTPLPSCPIGSVEQLLVDQIIARVMQLRGRPCLHASAVALQDAAIGFVGPTRSGKSTLSAALCRQGATLICDDCLSLLVEDDAVVVFPGYPSVRLWPDSADALVTNATALPLASPRTSKRRAAQPQRQGKTRLRMLVSLEPTAGPTTCERVTGAEAFSVLARQVHRLVEPGEDMLTTELDTLASVASRVALWRLRFPHDFDALDETVDQVRAALNQLLDSS